MERNPPVRNSHTSTADLLVWPSNPPADPSPTRTTTSAPRHGIRTHQPAGGISKVLFGGQTTEEEAESLNSRKPCSGPKLKEMTGSGIFSADGENSVAESGGAASYTHNRNGSKMHQQAIDAMSHISFSAEDGVSPRKGTSVSEVVRQRELGGHDIFAPPPEVPPRPLAARTLIKGGKGFEGPAPRNPAGSDSNFPFCEEIFLKTAKKSYSQKTGELSGNCVFKDSDTSPGSAEKSRSRAKHKEIGGSDIFSDGKAASHEYLGGVRKPPGGESSISLV